MEKEPIQEKNKPIAEIETDENILKAWEGVGLREEIKKEIIGLDNDTVVLYPETFKLTNSKERFNKLAFCKSPRKSEATDKLNERIAELESKDLKSVLAIAFQELGFDVYNPQLVKEEKISVNKKEVIVRYFATNKPDKFLVFDGEYWYLEKDEKGAEN